MTTSKKKTIEYIRVPEQGIAVEALMFEAWLQGRSISVEAGSLLSSILYSRKEYREEMLTATANLLGMSLEELKLRILAGTIDPLTSKSLQEVALQRLKQMGDSAANETNNVSSNAETNDS